MTTPKTIKVETFIDPDKAMHDTNTDATSIKDEVVRQSGLIYYYTSKYAEAVRQAARLKLQLEVVEARTAQEIRAEALEKGEKQTVDQVKALVRLNREVIALEIAKIDAESVEETLKGIVTAIKDKSSNLITLVTMERDQMKANLLVERDLSPDYNPDLAARGAALKDRLRASA